MRYLIAAAAALIAGSPSVAAAEDFTGFTASIGPAFVHADIAAEPGGVDASADIGAVTTIFHIGYDYEFQNGILVGASWWRAGEAEDDAGEFDGGTIDRLFGYEARAGYAAGPWLGFVGVGQMHRTVVLRFECPIGEIVCAPGDPVDADFNSDAMSYRVGAERRFGELFVSASYTWSDFDAQDIGFGTTVGDSDIGAAVVELGMRF